MGSSSPLAAPDFKLLFESAPGLYLVLTPELYIVAVSDEYTRATLTQRESILNRHLFEVFPDNPDDPEATGVANLRASLDRVVLTLSPDAMAVQKYDIRRPDSEGGGFTVRYWSPVNTPVRGPTGELAYIIHRVEDVTEFVRLKNLGNEQRRVTEELQQLAGQMESEIFRRAQEIQEVNQKLFTANQKLAASNVELARASDTKSQFLAMMSHELRTPLNSIIGFSEVLIDKQFGDLNERQLRYMGNVLSSGRHLLGLINDLLDFSKIEAGRLEVTREPCGLRTAAAEAIATLSPQAEAKKISVTVDKSGESPVVADPVRLKQVLYNLLSNAIKFTPDGGTVTISFAPTPEGAFVRTAVTDTGKGISSEDQSRLFKPFTQLENSGALSGTGLGLALTRQLVELMGGRIGLESRVGQGSTFYFDLTTAEEQLSVRSAPVDAPVVLVVDDDPHVRELDCIALHAAGYRTLAVATGELALVKAREGGVDAIVLDIKLPGVDGWHVLRQLREDEKTRRIPVVIVTVSGDRSKAVAFGADEHLTKPVDRETLMSAIERCRVPSASRDEPVRVLAIDDDERHLELVRSALEPRGFVVRTETTGHRGIAAVREKEPHLVLLDLLLPDISGVEVAVELRRASSSVPIIMLTAHELTDVDYARLNHSVEAVLSKGSTGTQSLVAQVERALRSGP